jgi:hypothetical protein
MESKKAGDKSPPALCMMARRQQKNLSGPGPQWSCCQRPRPHAKPGTNWWRDGLQGTSAAGTEFQPRVGAGEMRSQPVPARGTFLIDALHRPPRQILHRASPSGRGARTFVRRALEAVDTANCDAGSQWCQEQTTQDIGVGLPGCGFPVKASTIIGTSLLALAHVALLPST